MELLLVSFLAGAFTVAAPCSIPLLPVIIGGSAGDDRRRPFLIALGLALSVFVFSLLLKGTTLLLGVPDLVWALVSGAILIAFGAVLLFPALWDFLQEKTGLASRSALFLEKRAGGSAILLGAALGPVFNSCSPTYAVIVAIALPASTFEGVLYLALYSVGLAATLLLLGLLSQRVFTRLHWARDRQGLFYKVLGIIFIAVGVGVIFGADRDIQAMIIEEGWYDPIAKLEDRLLP